MSGGTSLLDKCNHDLFIAIESQSTEYLDEILRDKFVRTKLPQVVTPCPPLLYAIHHQNWYAVDRLLAANRTIVNTLRYGSSRAIYQSPLTKCIMDGAPPLVIDRLLESSASINLSDINPVDDLAYHSAHNGFSFPILAAIFKQDIPTLHALVSCGGDLNNPCFNITALGLASITGGPALVHELLRLGADPNATNVYGDVVLCELFYNYVSPDCMVAMIQAGTVDVLFQFMPLSMPLSTSHIGADLFQQINHSPCYFDHFNVSPSFPSSISQSLHANGDSNCHNQHASRGSSSSVTTSSTFGSGILASKWFTRQHYMLQQLLFAGADLTVICRDRGYPHPYYYKSTLLKSNVATSVSSMDAVTSYPNLYALYRVDDPQVELDIPLPTRLPQSSSSSLASSSSQSNHQENGVDHCTLDWAPSPSVISTMTGLIPPPANHVKLLDKARQAMEGAEAEGDIPNFKYNHQFTGLTELPTRIPYAQERSFLDLHHCYRVYRSAEFQKEISTGFQRSCPETTQSSPHPFSNWAKNLYDAVIFPCFIRPSHPESYIVRATHETDIPPHQRRFYSPLTVWADVMHRMLYHSGHFAHGQRLFAWVTPTSIFQPQPNRPSSTTQLSSLLHSQSQAYPHTTPKLTTSWTPQSSFHHGGEMHSVYSTSPLHPSLFTPATSVIPPVLTTTPLSVLQLHFSTVDCFYFIIMSSRWDLFESLFAGYNVSLVETQKTKGKASFKPSNEIDGGNMTTLEPQLGRHTSGNPSPAFHGTTATTATPTPTPTSYSPIIDEYISVSHAPKAKRSNRLTRLFSLSADEPTMHRLQIPDLVPFLSRHRIVHSRNVVSSFTITPGLHQLCLVHHNRLADLLRSPHQILLQRYLTFNHISYQHKPNTVLQEVIIPVVPSRATNLPLSVDNNLVESVSIQTDEYQTTTITTSTLVNYPKVKYHTTFQTVILLNHKIGTTNYDPSFAWDYAIESQRIIQPDLTQHENSTKPIQTIAIHPQEVDSHPAFPSSPSHSQSSHVPSTPTATPLPTLPPRGDGPSTTFWSSSASSTASNAASSDPLRAYLELMYDTDPTTFSVFNTSRHECFYPGSVQLLNMMVYLWQRSYTASFPQKLFLNLARFLKSTPESHHKLAKYVHEIHQRCKDLGLYSDLQLYVLFTVLMSYSTHGFLCFLTYAPISLVNKYYTIFIPYYTEYLNHSNLMSSMAPEPLIYSLHRQLLADSHRWRQLFSIGVLDQLASYGLYTNINDSLAASSASVAMISRARHKGSLSPFVFTNSHTRFFDLHYLRYLSLTYHTLLSDCLEEQQRHAGDQQPTWSAQGSSTHSEILQHLFLSILAKQSFIAELFSVAPYMSETTRNLVMKTDPSDDHHLLAVPNHGLHGDPRLSQREDSEPHPAPIYCEKALETSLDLLLRPHYIACGYTNADSKVLNGSDFYVHPLQVFLSQRRGSVEGDRRVISSSTFTSSSTEEPHFNENGQAPMHMRLRNALHTAPILTLDTIIHILDTPPGDDSTTATAATIFHRLLYKYFQSITNAVMIYACSGVSLASPTLATLKAYLESYRSGSPMLSFKDIAAQAIMKFIHHLRCTAVLTGDIFLLFYCDVVMAIIQHEMVRCNRFVVKTRKVMGNDSSQQQQHQQDTTTKTDDGMEPAYLDLFSSKSHTSQLVTTSSRGVKVKERKSMHYHGDILLYIYQPCADRILCQAHFSAESGYLTSLFSHYLDVHSHNMKLYLVNTLSMFTFDQYIRTNRNTITHNEASSNNSPIPASSDGAVPHEIPSSYATGPRLMVRPTVPPTQRISYYCWMLLCHHYHKSRLSLPFSRGAVISSIPPRSYQDHSLTVQEVPEVSQVPKGAHSLNPSGSSQQDMTINKEDDQRKGAHYSFFHRINVAHLFGKPYMSLKAIGPFPPMLIKPMTEIAKRFQVYDLLKQAILGANMHKLVYYYQRYAMTYSILEIYHTFMEIFTLASLLKPPSKIHQNSFFQTSAFQDAPSEHFFEQLFHESIDRIHHNIKTNQYHPRTQFVIPFPSSDQLQMYFESSSPCHESRCHLFYTIFAIQLVLEQLHETLRHLLYVAIASLSVNGFVFILAQYYEVAHLLEMSDYLLTTLGKVYPTEAGHLVGLQESYHPAYTIAPEHRTGDSLPTACPPPIDAIHKGVYLHGKHITRYSFHSYRFYHDHTRSMAYHPFVLPIYGTSDSPPLDMPDPFSFLIHCMLPMTMFMQMYRKSEMLRYYLPEDIYTCLTTTHSSQRIRRSHEIFRECFPYYLTINSSLFSAVQPSVHTGKSPCDPFNQYGRITASTMTEYSPEIYIKTGIRHDIVSPCVFTLSPLTLTHSNASMPYCDMKSQLFRESNIHSMEGNRPSHIVWNQSSDPKYSTGPAGSTNSIHPNTLHILDYMLQEDHTTSLGSGGGGGDGSGAFSGDARSITRQTYPSNRSQVHAHPSSESTTPPVNYGISPYHNCHSIRFHEVYTLACVMLFTNQHQIVTQYGILSTFCGGVLPPATERGFQPYAHQSQSHHTHTLTEQESRNIEHDGTSESENSLVMILRCYNELNSALRHGIPRQPQSPSQIHTHGTATITPGAYLSALLTRLEQYNYHPSEPFTLDLYYYTTFYHNWVYNCLESSMQSRIGTMPMDPHDTLALNVFHLLRVGYTHAQRGYIDSHTVYKIYDHEDTEILALLNDLDQIQRQQLQLQRQQQLHGALLGGGTTAHTPRSPPLSPQNAGIGTTGRKFITMYSSQTTTPVSSTIELDGAPAGHHDHSAVLEPFISRAIPFHQFLLDHESGTSILANPHIFGGDLMIQHLPLIYTMLDGGFINQNAMSPDGHSLLSIALFLYHNALRDATRHDSLCFQQRRRLDIPLYRDLLHRLTTKYDACLLVRTPIITQFASGMHHYLYSIVSQSLHSASPPLLKTDSAKVPSWFDLRTMSIDYRDPEFLLNSFTLLLKLIYDSNIDLDSFTLLVKNRLDPAQPMVADDVFMLNSPLFIILKCGHISLLRLIALTAPHSFMRIHSTQHNIRNSEYQEQEGQQNQSYEADANTGAEDEAQHWNRIREQAERNHDSHQPNHPSLGDFGDEMGVGFPCYMHPVLAFCYDLLFLSCLLLRGGKGYEDVSIRSVTASLRFIQKYVISILPSSD